MSIKILDELDNTRDQGLREFIDDPSNYEDGGYESVTEHANLVEKALPALIRVARAAEEYMDAPTEAHEFDARANMYEALQALRNLNAAE